MTTTPSTVDQVEYAEKVFKQLRPEFLLSGPILRVPQTRQTRKVVHGDGLVTSLGERWSICGEHSTLMSLIASGAIPNGYYFDGEYETPPSYLRALRFASANGYSVPPRFVEEAERGESIPEKEAWRAALMVVKGHHGCWKPTFADARRSILPENWNLRGQFIVPDPLVPTKTPYFLDQLWIVANARNEVRLVCLEIDGEVHANEDEGKARERDVKLAALGYEVFHAAGWWCRVDPYRVICEFLSVSEICPGICDHLIGSELHALDQYTCEICGRRMARWDSNWIAEAYRDGVDIPPALAHQKCAAEMD